MARQVRVTCLLTVVAVPPHAPANAAHTGIGQYHSPIDATQGVWCHSLRASYIDGIESRSKDRSLPNTDTSMALEKPQQFAARREHLRITLPIL